MMRTATGGEERRRVEEERRRKEIVEGNGEQKDAVTLVE
jgi:hypothetical protein